MTDAKASHPRFSLITLIVAVNVAGVLVWATSRTTAAATLQGLCLIAFAGVLTELLVRKLRKADRHDE